MTSPRLTKEQREELRSLYGAAYIVECVVPQETLLALLDAADERDRLKAELEETRAAILAPGGWDEQNRKLRAEVDSLRAERDAAIRTVETLREENASLEASVQSMADHCDAATQDRAADRAVVETLRKVEYGTWIRVVGGEYDGCEGYFKHALVKIEASMNREVPGFVVIGERPAEALAKLVEGEK